LTCPLQRVHDWLELGVKWNATEGRAIVLPRAKNHTAEEITPKLRASRAGKIAKAAQSARSRQEIGVTEPDVLSVGKEYVDLRTDQAKRLNGTEKRTLRLKRLLADAEVGIKAILREAASALLSPVGSAQAVEYVPETPRSDAHCRERERPGRCRKILEQPRFQRSVAVRPMVPRNMMTRRINTKRIVELADGSTARYGLPTRNGGR